MSPRAGRLAGLVRAWPRTRLPLLDLWRLLDEAAILAELLDELARAELIALPTARSFDRTERPHLPGS